MHYEPIPVPGDGDLGRVLSRGDLAELRLVALSAALHAEDCDEAERLCIRLANHEDAITRGNSILGLGHLARIHRTLTEAAARPAVEAALRDSDAWVRGQATCAADDIEHYLGWTLDRPSAFTIQHPRKDTP